MSARAARAALLFVLTLVFGACVSRAATPADSDLVRVTFLQINDAYVLEPVDSGRRGGMARLATLVHEARRENPNTIFVIGGDFLSPSVESTFLQGSQMVAALDAVGLDYATFGNHEFDFGPAVLAERMASDLEQGGACVVIGVAHCPGVLARLRAGGFDATQWS